MRDGHAIVLVVEDTLSEAVMRKVIEHHSPTLAVAGRVFVTGGSGNIRANVERYRNASNVYPHVVLTDLDQYECPGALLADWSVGQLPPNLLFRIAVRSVESWLLADRERIAQFLQIPLNKVCQAPENVVDCKHELISLARRARSRRLATELCPATGSIAKQGPLYNAHMTRFVRESWRVDVATSGAASLKRACVRMSELSRRLSA